MSALYLDQGPGFVAQDTIAVMANLGIPLIHGEAGYKQGRGKVKRFNRTVKADVRRGLDGRPDVGPACGSLQPRLAHYTNKVYAQRPHESLGGDSPWQWFLTDPKPLHWTEDHEHLKAMFEICFNRRVSPDIILLPTDRAANARAPRATDTDYDEPPAMAPTTAAQISYDRDFGTIVDRDGGFNDSCLRACMKK